MFEFEDLAHFCCTVFCRESLGLSGLHFVWSGHPRAQHPTPHLTRGTPASILPSSSSRKAQDSHTQGPSLHPVLRLCPCTSGAATEAQGRWAFMLFFLFPFYVVCGHIMEGGFWMGLFSCQPELLIQSGFFFFFFFFPSVDFILGNGRVTGWQGWPSHRPLIASLTEAEPHPGPRQREAASAGKHPGLICCCWCPWQGGARQCPLLCPVTSTAFCWKRGLKGELQPARGDAASPGRSLRGIRAQGVPNPSKPGCARSPSVPSAECHSPSPAGQGHPSYVSQGGALDIAHRGQHRGAPQATQCPWQEAIAGRRPGRRRLRGSAPRGHGSLGTAAVALGGPDPASRTRSLPG